MEIIKTLRKLWNNCSIEKDTHEEFQFQEESQKNPLDLDIQQMYAEELVNHEDVNNKRQGIVLLEELEGRLLSAGGDKTDSSTNEEDRSRAFSYLKTIVYTLAQIGSYKEATLKAERMTRFYDNVTEYIDAINMIEELREQQQTFEKLVVATTSMVGSVALSSLIAWQVARKFYKKK